MNLNDLRKKSKKLTAVEEKGSSWTRDPRIFKISKVGDLKERHVALHILPFNDKNTQDAIKYNVAPEGFNPEEESLFPIFNAINVGFVNGIAVNKISPYTFKLPCPFKELATKTNKHVYSLFTEDQKDERKAWYDANINPLRLTTNRYYALVYCSYDKEVPENTGKVFMYPFSYSTYTDIITQYKNFQEKEIALEKGETINDPLIKRALNPFSLFEDGCCVFLTVDYGKNPMIPSYSVSFQQNELKDDVISKAYEEQHDLFEYLHSEIGDYEWLKKKAMDIFGLDENLDSKNPDAIAGQYNTNTHASSKDFLNKGKPEVEHEEPKQEVSAMASIAKNRILVEDDEDEDIPF